MKECTKIRMMQFKHSTHFLNNMTLKLIDENITPEEIRLLGKWRKKVQPAWGETFKITFKGTEKWIHGIIDNPTKMLFFVMVKDKPIGHVGFDSTGVDLDECFIGNIIRGKGKSDGSMIEAIKTLITIGKKFGHNVCLKTQKNNIRAIQFYKKIGFRVYERINNDLIMKYVKSQ